MGKIKIQLLISFAIVSSFCFGQSEDYYLEVIKKTGDNPIDFVQQKLETHNLILFDDGLHSAYEPFQFYSELINVPETKFDYVFVEVLGINV